MFAVLFRCCGNFHSASESVRFTSENAEHLLLTTIMIIDTEELPGDAIYVRMEGMLMLQLMGHLHASNEKTKTILLIILLILPQYPVRRGIPAFVYLGGRLLG
jgi:hypothetical protein